MTSLYRTMRYAMLGAPRCQYPVVLTLRTLLDLFEADCVATWRIKSVAYLRVMIDSRNLFYTRLI